MQRETVAVEPFVVSVHVVTLIDPSGAGTTAVTARPCSFLQAPTQTLQPVDAIAAISKREIHLERMRA